MKTPNPKSKIPTWIILTILLLTVIVYAQPQQSENFRMAKSVIDAGGTASTSANFRLYSAFGQPTPLGLQSSTNFVLSAGYLSPMFQVSPLSPIQNLVIKAEQPNIRLWWGPIPEAHMYYIYRSTNSSMMPDSTSLIGSTADTFYTDAGATSLAALRYFYYVSSSRATFRSAGLAHKEIPAIEQPIPVNEKQTLIREKRNASVDKGK